jgi:dihydroorotase-like cyclic amidohydrolase
VRQWCKYIYLNIPKHVTLTHVQVEEFPAVSSVDIEKALLELKDSATTLMFHAEMIPPISDSVGDDIQRSNPPLAPKGPLTSYDTFLQSRPPSFETCAVAEILSLAHLAPELQLHIVHLSAIEAIPMLRKAPCPCGGRYSRRRHTTQVLPAHPFPIEPRRSVGGTSPRHS